MKISLAEVEQVDFTDSWLLRPHVCVLLHLRGGTSANVFFPDAVHQEYQNNTCETLMSKIYKF